MKSEYNTSFYDDESRRCPNCGKTKVSQNTDVEDIGKVPLVPGMHAKCPNCGEEFKVPYVVSNPEVVSVESQN